MSDASLDGVPIMAGRLSECRRGNWELECLLATAGEEQPPTGEVEFQLLDTTWQGFVLRSGDPYQQNRAWVTGGKGKLTERVEPRDYRVTSFLQIVQELMDDAGEVLDFENSVGLDQMLQGWSRFRQRAIYELEQLVGLRRELDGAVWRMQRDGRLVVAPPVATDCDQNLIFVAEWPQRGQRLYALEDEADGVRIAPGQRLEPGLLIDRIDWVIKPSKLRLYVWTAPEPTT